jgi:hypothetical protein
MARTRFVDLSISIEPGLPSDPPMMIPRIDYIDHSQGAEQMKDFFPGDDLADHPFRDSSGCALSLSPHHGPRTAVSDHRRGAPAVVFQ